jgi:hypothetical protein
MNRRASSFRRKQEWPPTTIYPVDFHRRHEQKWCVVLRAPPRPYGISAYSLRMVFLPRSSVITSPGHSLMSGTCSRMPDGLAPNAGPLKCMPAAPRHGSERDEGLVPAEPMRTESPRTAAGAEARSRRADKAADRLCLAVRDRRPQPESGRGDSEQEHVRRDGSRPATGTFGTLAAAMNHASCRTRGRRRAIVWKRAYPWQIPLSGWKDIFWRTHHRIGEDRLRANPPLTTRHRIADRIQAGLRPRTA